MERISRLFYKLKYFIKGKRYYVPFGCISTSNGSNLRLGKHISFGGNVFLFGTSIIEIGDFTMIAYGVIIHTSTHSVDLHPMRSLRIDRPVKIGSHVWIGAGAIILPGIVVEDFSVIGSGSVVTKNVPKGAIVVGNPARILRYRDTNVYSQIFDVNNVIYENRDEGFIDSYLE